MAFSEVETTVVNPASKLAERKGKKVAKHLSAKQIKYFGSKRQKAALKAKRSNSAKKAFKAKSLRPRTVPKKSNPAARKKSFVAKAEKRRNPTPEIISFVLGNPARKKGKTMAKSFKNKKASSTCKTNAGRPKTSYKKSFKSSAAKRNPAGLGRPMDWVKGGVGVLAGVVVTRALPQAVASTYNTGAAGYAMNGGTAIAAAWAAHAMTKDPVLTAAVAAGGFAAVIARIISDMTSFGQYLSLTGVGDYQFSNFSQPQRLINQNQAMYYAPDGSTPATMPATTSYDTGEMGRRGGWA